MASVCVSVDVNRGVLIDVPVHVVAVVVSEFVIRACVVEVILIIVEIDGEDDAALEAQAKKMEAVARQCGVYQFRVAQSQQESDELWAIRRGAAPASSRVKFFCKNN